MAIKLNRSFATAILSGALAFGGLSVAAAPQDDASKPSATTKAKGLSATELRERRITADLNRRQLTQGPQVAQAPITGQQPPTGQQPTTGQP